MRKGLVWDILYLYVLSVCNNNESMNIKIVIIKSS